MPISSELGTQDPRLLSYTNAGLDWTGVAIASDLTFLSKTQLPGTN